MRSSLRVRDIKRIFKIHIEPLVADVILHEKSREHIEFTVEKINSPSRGDK